jgi:hypothetical protein
MFFLRVLSAVLGLAILWSLFSLFGAGFLAGRRALPQNGQLSKIQPREPIEQSHDFDPAPFASAGMEWILPQGHQTTAFRVQQGTTVYISVVGGQVAAYENGMIKWGCSASNFHISASSNSLQDIRISACSGNVTVRINQVSQ